MLRKRKSYLDESSSDNDSERTSPETSASSEDESTYSESSETCCSNPCSRVAQHFRAELRIQAFIQKAKQKRSRYEVVAEINQNSVTRDFLLLDTSEPGEMYHVRIGTRHFCDCLSDVLPCEHILIVLMFEFRIPENSSWLRLVRWNRCLKSHLFSRFDDLSLVDRESEDTKVVRKDWKQEDKCPICLESMRATPIIWCKDKCGNTFHHKCAKQWVKVSRKKTCPICRTFWSKSF
jgi:hypothetical protein